MAQAVQAPVPGKNKSKGGMSTQTMISAGIGGAVVVEGVVLALLWKKVNDIATKSDPNTNDNKHIAQYIALRDKEHDEQIKQLIEKVKTLETEQKKPAANAPTDPAIVKKLNKLTADYDTLRDHVNSLTAAFNELEKTVAAQTTTSNNRGRKPSNNKKYEDEQSSEGSYASSPSPQRSRPPPASASSRRATNVAPPKKPPTQQPANTRRVSTATNQKTATATNTATSSNKKKVATNMGTKEAVQARAADEMPSDMDSERD